MDWICHFNTAACGLAVGDTTAWVTGLTVDGREIVGSDSVRVLAK